MYMYEGNEIPSLETECQFFLFFSFLSTLHSGELALLTGQLRSSTVVAQDRVEALVMDKNTLMELRTTVPTLEDHIVRGMRHYDHIEQFTSMAMA